MWLQLPEKTPGDEKADVGRNTAAERRSSQLYDADKPPTRGAGGSKDAANRLDKHEQMLKDVSAPVPSVPLCCLCRAAFPFLSLVSNAGSPLRDPDYFPNTNVLCF